MKFQWRIAAAWLSPVVVWVVILLVIGGWDALGFFLKALLVLTVLSVVGAGVEWITHKIGVSIDD